jgi:ParB/RepB/Spo0J family partition protein
MNEEKIETPTTEKPAKKAATPKKGAKSDVASSSAALAGYAAVFKQWEPVPCDPGPVTVTPGKLIALFDVRSHLQPIDEFVKQCAGGINTPIQVTKMKYLGETGEQNVHPDGKTRVLLTHGETYTVIVYGRRRTRAGLKLNFKTLDATLKSYKDWQSMVADAYVENDGRADMTQWDRTCHIKNLSDGGMLQDDIALAVQPRISAGSISQYLGVFDMPETVIKLFQNEQLGVSHIRALRPLRKQVDAVTALATRAADKGWTEDQTKEAVKSFNERQAATPPSGDEPAPGKGKKVTRSKGFSDAQLTLVKVADARKTLNWLDTQIKKLRAKETPDPVKVARALGKMEGFQMATGLKETPAAALVEDEPESDE